MALAVAVLVLAEWPRLAARLPSRAERRRQRRRKDLRIVQPPSDESDEFAASVERDLARLPTIKERDHNN